MSDKMVRTQIYLPPDIYEALKKRAEEDGISMGRQIREAVAKYVTDRMKTSRCPSSRPTIPSGTLWACLKAGLKMVPSTMISISIRATGTGRMKKREAIR